MTADRDPNGIEWQLQLQSMTSDRTVLIYGLRKSRARLLKMLTPAQRDASREIDWAYEDREKGGGRVALGYPATSFTRVRGASGGKENSQDQIDAINARIDKLVKWERLCPALLRNTVLALNQTGQTAKTWAERLGVYTNGKKTKPDTGQVTLWYREGLRVYCKLQGWD